MAGRYCGTFHNQTLNADAPGEIDVRPGGSFSGIVIVGGGRLTGGGNFTGRANGAQCSGTDSAGLQFQGACPTGGEYRGSYTMWGQTGTFSMSSDACR